MDTHRPILLPGVPSGSSPWSVVLWGLSCALSLGWSMENGIANAASTHPMPSQTSPTGEPHASSGTNADQPFSETRSPQRAFSVSWPQASPTSELLSPNSSPGNITSNPIPPASPVNPPTPHFHDIYLTRNRICKRCMGQWASATQIRLINRAGETTLVRPAEILGVNQHPGWRRVILHSLHGVGLPGPVTVPSAFDNGDEFACKYCHELNK